MQWKLETREIEKMVKFRQKFCSENICDITNEQRRIMS